MIISDSYKYLFVELPRTGSTAIAKELCRNYGGQSICFKHATYRNFLKVASPEQREYFVFSSIRNPLDDAVTQYFKCKTDPAGSFSGLKQDFWFRRMAFSYRIRRYDFTKKYDADFPTFFRRFYRLPHDNWSCLAHKQFDYVMRFEHLPDEFEQVLQKLNIEPVRRLPHVNQTQEKRKAFEEYYTPDIQRRAAYVFGPYMEKWGYAFPSNFGKVCVPPRAHSEVRVLNVIRKLYWNYLRAPVYRYAYPSPGHAPAQCSTGLTSQDRPH